MGSPGGSDDKESTCSAGYLDLISGSGRSSGGGHGKPLLYSWLENPKNRGAGGLQSMGSQRVRHNWATKYTHRVLVSIAITQLSHCRAKAIVDNIRRMCVWLRSGSLCLEERAEWARFEPWAICWFLGQIMSLYYLKFLSGFPLQQNEIHCI